MSGTLLAFTENYVRGGGNRYLVDTINGIAPLFDRIVLVSNRGGVFPEDLARFRHPVVHLPVQFANRAALRMKCGRIPRVARAGPLLLMTLLWPVLYSWNAAVLLRILRRVRPRVVISFNGGYPAARLALLAVGVGRLARVKVVLSIVSVPAARRVHERLLDGLVWRAADRVLVNADAIRQTLIAERGAPVDRVAVVHNGLDDRPPAVRTHDASEVWIGCVSRLDPQKGALVLLEAFERAQRVLPDLRLSLTGEGDASAAIARRIDEAGLRDRVRTHGFRAGDVSGLVGDLDIYAFPSLHEGFPYSVLEAMRAGCAIVATRVGGVPEMLSDGRDAMLVPPGDSAALADALLTMSSDPELRRRLGSRSRERFLSEFQLGEMERRVRQLIEEL